MTTCITRPTPRSATCASPASPKIIANACDFFDAGHGPAVRPDDRNPGPEGIVDRRLETACLGGDREPAPHCAEMAGVGYRREARLRLNGSVHAAGAACTGGENKGGCTNSFSVIVVRNRPPEGGRVGSRLRLTMARVRTRSLRSADCLPRLTSPNPLAKARGNWRSPPRACRSDMIWQSRSRFRPRGQPGRPLNAGGGPLG